jgi:hypothetical protein
VPKSSTKETVEEERTPAEAFAPEPTVEDEPNTDRLKSETPGDNPLVEECIQRTYVEAAMVEREHAEFHN